MIHRTVTSWVALMGCVLSGAAGLDGVELCVGLDGHVGVAEAPGSCCHGGDALFGPADHGVASRPAGASHEHRSASCVDIPLSPGQRAELSRRPVRRTCRLDREAVFATVIRPGALGWTGPSKPAVPSGQPPGASERQALNTIILLI